MIYIILKYRGLSIWDNKAAYKDAISADGHGWYAEGPSCLT